MPTVHRSVMVILALCLGFMNRQRCHALIRLGHRFQSGGMGMGLRARLFIAIKAGGCLGWRFAFGWLTELRWAYR